jgi:hypothetical protein
MCQVNYYHAEDTADSEEHIQAMEEDGWTLSSYHPDTMGTGQWVVMQRAACAPPLAASRPDLRVE